MALAGNSPCVPFLLPQASKLNPYRCGVSNDINCAIFLAWSCAMLSGRSFASKQRRGPGCWPTARIKLELLCLCKVEASSSQ